MKRMLTAAALLSSLAFAGAAYAEEHEVLMLNRGSDGEAMVFEPAFLKVAPGDTVRFVPTDMSHNSEAVLGMLPEGAEAWKGKINEEIAVTFDAEGVYGVKCLPHYALGMVALVQVGEDLSNLDEALTVKHPGRAAQRMAVLFEQVEGGETTAQAEGN